MRHSSGFGSRGLRREESLTSVTTQECEDVDLRPTTASTECEDSSLDNDWDTKLICNLDSDESSCLNCPAYDKYTRSKTPARVDQGRTAEKLHPTRRKLKTQLS